MDTAELQPDDLEKPATIMNLRLPLINVKCIDWPADIR